MALGIAATSWIGEALANKQFDKVNLYTSNIFFIFLCFSIVMPAICLPLVPILVKSLGAKEETVFAYAK